MEKYIKMLLYKLKGKVDYSVRYMIKYEGTWETYYNKRDVVDRLIEIEREDSYGEVNR